MLELARVQVWWNNHGARAGRPWFVKDLETGRTMEALCVSLLEGTCTTVLDPAPKLGGSMHMTGRVAVTPA